MSQSLKYPLFKDVAWKMADNVLAGILEGYSATPPAISCVHNVLHGQGSPKTDKNGRELFYHTFGTNREEAIHKRYTKIFPSWNIGVEMATYVLNEHRHRYTHNVSERRRPGFPSIGHYDTTTLGELMLCNNWWSAIAE
jgi:hypothetical protein